LLPGCVYINKSRSLKTELEPVGVEDHLAGQSDENDQENKSAPTSGAGGALTETKSFLKPVE